MERHADEAAGTLTAGYIGYRYSTGKLKIKTPRDGA